MPALLATTPSTATSIPKDRAVSLSNITALDYVRRSGILIASDGAEYNRIAEFSPLDATSNPSLVLAAVTNPEYSHLVDEAIEYALQKEGEMSQEERVTLALLKLLVLVGVQILRIIPGRVSASVDPRTGYSIPAMLNQARTIISLFEEHSVPRSRVLIKIPGTPEGITAAHILEHPLPSTSTSSSSPSSATEQPIHTNITLIFGRSQGLACAQAGVSVISPFVGRVKDWWDAQGYDTSNTHPGMQLVSSIQRAYRRYGYKGKTEVMAAGFRKPEEVLAMAAGFGRPGEAANGAFPPTGWEATKKGGKEWKKGPFEAADLVTIPPELLSGLKNWNLGSTSSALNGKTGEPSREVEIGEDTEPIYFEAPAEGQCVKGIWTTGLYESTLANSRTEKIVLDKVSEGLSKFSVDAERLENIVREKLLAALH